jgi:ectoine hydroxylase-related dioxygenase (phytanoyl-CoA dioxygenase family)
MTSTAEGAAQETAERVISDDVVQQYRRDGVTRIPGVISREDAARFRDAALAAKERITDHYAGSAIFNQYVNVWTQDEALRELTLNPVVASVATQLAGIPLRLWHDHVLIKPPHNGAATEFHQDAPYWPHDNCRHALSAWIALVDVPVERGCMTFIPGSHGHHGLRAQDLSDSKDLFRVAPDLQWEQRVTIPLRAGDCTFHNAYLAHTATPNMTDDPRVAHINIYIDAETVYNGAPHPVTDGLGLQVGQTLDTDLFPALP